MAVVVVEAKERLCAFEVDVLVEQPEYFVGGLHCSGDGVVVIVVERMIVLFFVVSVFSALACLIGGEGERGELN